MTIELTVLISVATAVVGALLGISTLAMAQVQLEDLQRSIDELQQKETKVEE